MFITAAKSHGIAYLRLQEAYTYVENGVRKNSTRTLYNIGSLAKHDDGYPNYVARLKASFANGTPLIPELLPFCEGNKRPPITLTFDPNEPGTEYAESLNVGYALLEPLYKALGIHDVLVDHKRAEGVGYDLGGIAKLLVFGRVMTPDSKLATYGQRDKYFLEVAKNAELQHVYGALDELDALSETIQDRMNESVKSSSIGRNTEVCYYDVTNYYFEIHENDADTVDESGNVVEEGLRKKGVSKEKRPEPIVQMGLFIDDNGIPIGYKLFPGNNTDTTTLRPALEKTVHSMGLSRVIIVADGGLNSDKNVAHILNAGNGYIVSKSTKKCNKTERDWVLEQGGYTYNESRNFKVKSRIRVRKIKDENGVTREITEKQVSFWSKAHYDREMHENEKFLEYLDSVIANPDKLKDKKGKVAQFLKTAQVDETGEVLTVKPVYSIDWDKVNEWKKLMGYYTLQTSEIDKSDAEIINKYHGLSRIEDSFRITKSQLEGRPVYVRTKAHINAHFLICFIALTMIRLLQTKLLKSQGKSTTSANGWTSGITAETLQETLRGFTVIMLPQQYCWLSKPTDALRELTRVVDADIPLGPITAHELRLWLSKASKAFSAL